jgi:hypothetical protein
MKATNRRPRRTKPDLRAESFSLSSAKNYLGRLMEKAGRGETVYILRGERRFILQEVSPIPPIPIRPPGYFGRSYSQQEIREENRLAKSSVLRPPQDLE